MKNSFVDLTSLGLLSITIGVVAITYGFNRPLLSFSLGAVGIIFGIISLRIPKQEKLEKRLSWLGIVLSATSVIWSLVNVYVR